MNALDSGVFAAAYSLPPAVRPPLPQSPLLGSDDAKRAQINETAQKFEASFLSSMIGEMFEGVETAAPFGGGEGEAAFRSFLTEAMGKSIAKRGGVGLSKAIAGEMLKMQGLS